MSAQRFSVGLLLCLLSSMAAAPALAQDSKPLELCRDRVIDELSTVHDEYRSVLFGSREDEDGNFIANTGGKVDEERTGIFETRYRETPDLVWPLVESYRVLRCRSVGICQAMQQSFTAEDDDALNVALLGCREQSFTPYDECKFVQKNSVADPATLTTDCTQLVNDSLTMEQGVLRIAVAYDSGYRGALQFVGMTDWMMKDFPKRAFIPLRGMVNMLGKLYQIPCFMGQCDMPDNSDIQLPEGNSPLNDPPNPDAFID